jgi:predicted outer membrane repeat protein
MTNVTISRNTANYGGGICGGNFSPIMTNVTISENTANYGGGIYGTCQLNNVIINRNKANIDGGGIHARYIKSTNVLICENIANNNGGGIYGREYYFYLINVTISRNRANNSSGGIHFTNPRANYVLNSIIFQNSANNAPDIHIDDHSNVYLSYSLIGDTSHASGKGVILLAGNIINANPMFVNSYNGNYRLSPSSPAVNAGNNAFYDPDSILNLSTITTDLDNNPRINCIVDMGAYEDTINFIMPNRVQPYHRICYGDSTSVLLDLQGEAPWEVIYTSDNGQTFDTVKNIMILPYYLQVSPADTTVYMLVKIQDARCNIKVTDSFTVYVIPPPSLFNVLVSDTLCSGEQTKAIVFTGTATDFEWKATGLTGIPTNVHTGDFGIYTLENKTQTPLTGIINVVPKYTTDTISCTGDMQQFSITVLPEPILTNTLVNDSLCSGALTKAIVFTGTATDFEWKTTGTTGIPTGIQTGNFSSYKVENKTATTLQSLVTVSPQYRMGSTMCLGEPKSFNVLVYPQTQLQSLTKNRLIYCEEQDLLNLEAEASGADLTYQWYYNNAALTGETNIRYTEPVVNTAHSGTYFIEINGKCGTVKSDDMLISVGSDTMLVEKWHDVILVDNFNNTYYGYQWYRDGIKIPNATEQFYQEIGGLKGCYMVELSLQNGKKEFSCEHCVDKTTKSIAVYPNPVRQGEVLQIVCDSEDNEQQIITLYAINGEKILCKQMHKNLSEIETTNLQAGVYILRIQTAKGKMINRKIIIY